MEKLIHFIQLRKSIGLLAIVALGVFGLTVLTVSAQSAGYSLALSNSTVEAGETLRVSWTAPAGDNLQRDWIGVYEQGADNRAFVDWSYINTSARSGSVAFRIDEPGRYEVRYLKNDQYEQVGNSARIQVLAANISDSNANTRSSNDTYLCYADGSRVNGGGNYQGGTGGGNYQGGNSTTGTYSVTAPGGSYTVGDTIAISWTAPTNRNHRQGWIGIYATNSNDQSFQEWRYINQSSNSGTVNLKLTQPGTYEARFFTGNGFDRADRSNSFTVTRRDSNQGGGNYQGGTGGGSYQGGSTVADRNYSLSVTPRSVAVGDTIRVSWTADTRDNRNQDWIGVYRPGANNRDFLDWTYVNQVQDTATFIIDTPGTYEFRYLKNDRFNAVATSPTVQVSGTQESGTPINQCPIANVNQVTNYPPTNGPIIAFGDSLTAGVGASNNQDYVSQLEDRTGVSIRNAGVSGDTTVEAAARLERDVLSQNPSVVIVWLGGNDILGRYYARAQDGLESASVNQQLELLVLRLSGKIPDTTNITEAQTFQNLETIVNRIHADGAVVILVGFSGGVFNDDLDLMYQAVANATGAIYVPDIMAGLIGRPRFMSDLVHPNNRGYGMVADRIAPYLECTL